MRLVAVAVMAGCGGSGGNTPPVAVDQTIDTSAGLPTVITLFASNADDGPLTFVLDSMPSNGSLDTTSLPEVAYTSGGSFSGADSFLFSRQ